MDSVPLKQSRACGSSQCSSPGPGSVMNMESYSEFHITSPTAKPKGKKKTSLSFKLKTIWKRATSSGTSRRSCTFPGNDSVTRTESQPTLPALPPGAKPPQALKKNFTVSWVALLVDPYGSLNWVIDHRDVDVFYRRMYWWPWLPTAGFNMDCDDSPPAY